MIENVSIIAWITLALITIESYLRANKVWKRKHKKDVAESISLIAQGVGLITLSFFIASSYIEQSFNGLVSSGIWLSMTMFMVLVGSGFWVTDIRANNFWKKVKLYLMKETSELGNLASSFTSPNEREDIREIILKIALLDQKITSVEKEILDEVLHSWDDSIDYVALEKFSQNHEPSEVHNILSGLNQSISHYLSSSPAGDQVSKLADLIQLLIHSDKQQTDDNKLLITEVLEQLNSYILNSSNVEQYCVLVIPNNQQSLQTIQQAYPDLNSEPNNELPYLIKTGFHTKKMADIYRNNYLKHNCQSYIVVQN